MARLSPIHAAEEGELRPRRRRAAMAVLVLAGAVATWISLLTFLGADGAYGLFEETREEWIPDVETMNLAFPDISQSSRVYASGGELLAELHDGRIANPTPIEEIPVLVRNAVLAAEDSQFYEHRGVDFEAIASAALDNLLYDQTRGGSTITQQVAKQNFVGDDPTIKRKVAEAVVAAELERRYTKDEILEYYLNSVFFGANAYGVSAAADEYFDKPLADVTVEEAATLAVLIRNPSLYNPRKRPDLVWERRNAVIAEMEDHGWITPAEAEEARNKPVAVVERRPFRGPADHVVAEVTRQLLNDPSFAFLGSTSEERTRSVFGCPADDPACTGGGGLRIETTIDLAAQEAANAILTEWFPLLPYEENLAACKRIYPDDSEEYLAVFAETKSCAPTGAIATVDNRTGAVRVVASGLPFEVEQYDLAIQGRRNPGSSFKPFALVAALEKGMSLRSYWNGSSPKTIECPSVCSDLGNIWRVSNSGNTSYGSISLEAATYKSVNTVFAQLSMAVGPESIVDVAHRMGITSPLAAVPAIALGASAVSPLEMASAYSNFATNGEWAPPFLVNRIWDADGNLVYEHETTVTQVSRPEVLAAARIPLEKVPTSQGTASRAAIGRPQGGKTGTHQQNSDVWYVGFVPQYTTAVWAGYADNQIPLRNVRIHGQAYSTVFGGSVPAPIWKEFMDVLLADIPVEEFPEVDPELLEPFVEPPRARVPSVLGLDAAAARERLGFLGFGVAEERVGSDEPAGTVVSQSPGPGTRVAVGTTVTIGVSEDAVETATVPDVVGLSVDDAVDRIRSAAREAGIDVDVDVEGAEGSPEASQTVLATSPGVGTPLRDGATVTLIAGA